MTKVRDNHGDEDRHPASEDAAADRVSRQHQESDFESVHRIVAHQGKRHNFRIERIFWRILSLAAAAERKRLGAYIAAVLEDNVDQGNMSSVLRTHAAEWLSQQMVEVAAKSLSARSVSGIVQAMPTPCFSMDLEARITGWNEPFLKLLEQLLAEEPGNRINQIRIRFKSDLKAIFVKLHETPRAYVEEMVSVKYLSGHLTRPVRIVRMDTVQGAPKGIIVCITA